MNAGIRNIVFVLALSCFGGLFMWGLLGLAPVGEYPGPYGDILNAISVPERHITDVVTAVNFDFRGFDTLGEEFIMFSSVMGVLVLLRHVPDGRGKRDQSRRRRVAPVSDAVRVLTVLLVGPVVLFGIYMVTHGQISPGGGFQGGVILATAPLLVYLAGEFKRLMKIAPHQVLEIGEAVGAAGYAVVGAVALASGLPFLQNVLPLGKAGDVFSGGTVVFIDLTVGLEVAAGFILLLMTFLEEEIQRKEPK